MSEQGKHYYRVTIGPTTKRVSSKTALRAYLRSMDEPCAQVYTHSGLDTFKGALSKAQIKAQRPQPLGISAKRWAEIKNSYVY